MTQTTGTLLHAETTEMIHSWWLWIEKTEPVKQQPLLDDIDIISACNIM